MCEIGHREQSKALMVYFEKGKRWWSENMKIVTISVSLSPLIHLCHFLPCIGPSDLCETGRAVEKLDSWNWKWSEGTGHYVCVRSVQMKSSQSSWGVRNCSLFEIRGLFKKKIWLFSTSEGRHFKKWLVWPHLILPYMFPPPKYISEKINGLKTVMQGNQQRLVSTCTIYIF